MQLLGPDSNANGVRDDVDAVIANTYSDTVQRQRATVYATWLTWATLRGARATASSSAELTSFSNAVACAYETRIAALGGTADGQDALYGTVLNTVERTRAYLTWDASTSGTPSVMDMQPCSHLSEVPSP